MPKFNRDQLNGMIVVDKPRGITSKDVSRWLLKRLGKIKMGHVGTLDPMANGVLPILLGKATRLQDYLLAHRKGYEFDVTLGQMTDTLDAEGTVVDTKPWDHITKESIEEILDGFTGNQVQIPPLYSAVKYKGKPLYDYARKGKADCVDLDSCKREVHIYSLRLERYVDGVATFSVECSSGTYVRVLAYDISMKLGSCGTVTRLVRTYTSGIYLSGSIPLDNLQDEEEILSHVVPMEGIKLKLCRLDVARPELVEKLFSGQKLFLDVERCEEFVGGLRELGVTQGTLEEVILHGPSGEVFGLGIVSLLPNEKFVIKMKKGLL